MLEFVIVNSINKTPDSPYYDSIAITMGALLPGAEQDELLLWRATLKK